MPGNTNIEMIPWHRQLLGNPACTEQMGTAAKGHPCGTESLLKTSWGLSERAFLALPEASWGLRKGLGGLPRFLWPSSQVPRGHPEGGLIDVSIAYMSNIDSNPMLLVDFCWILMNSNEIQMEFECILENITRNALQ